MSGTETRERLTDDEREALYRAGEHHPDTCDCSAYVIEQSFAEDDCCTALSETFETVERIIAARDAAARAEVAALRSRIEDLARDGEAHGRGNSLDLSRRLREVLASVGSSGEAESGEGASGGWLCRHGKYRHEHWCDDHLDHERRMQTTAPAPVSSGGQADGVGECFDVGLRRDEIERLGQNQRVPGGWLFDEVEGIISGRLRHFAAARPVLQADGVGECCAAFTEAACEVGHRILIDDGDGGDYACPVCALAARPVLSREALRARLDGHWPTFQDDDDLIVSCDCGWTSQPDRSESGFASAQYRDHLADVLAGGEQA